MPAGGAHSSAPADRGRTRPLRRAAAPPPGPEVRPRAGKMDAAAGPLRSVRRLSRVLLFLSQCYILSGDGESKAGAAPAELVARGLQETREVPSLSGRGRAAPQ